MSKTPQATVTVGDAKLTRDVCSLTIRTRAEGSNTLRLAGGVDIKVDDEYAHEVASVYYKNVDSDTSETGDSDA
jgi:hypothetical protein